MTRKRVPLHQQAGRFVDIDPEATVGATVGVDLRWTDGSRVDEAALRAALSAVGAAPAPAHVATATARWVSPPASQTAPGKAGDIAADASFFYVCHATNAWLRIAAGGW